jgi:hypothetical protein
VLPALLSTPPPGDDVTVYPVIAVPPLEAGAAKVTVAWALPAEAEAPVGTPGRPAKLAVTDLDALIVIMQLLPEVESQPVQEPNEEFVPGDGVKVATADTLIDVLPPVVYDSVDGVPVVVPETVPVPSPPKETVSGLVGETPVPVRAAVPPPTALLAMVRFAL